MAWYCTPTLMRSAPTILLRFREVLEEEQFDGKIDNGISEHVGVHSVDTDGALREGWDV